MRVTKIEQDGRIYKVTLTPNLIQRLLGMKTKIKEVKEIFGTYVFGDGNVYVDKKGRKLGNGNWIGEAIDNHKRSF